MIRVHHSTEEALRWYYARDYEGPMGRRSTMGGITETIRQGALVDGIRGGNKGVSLAGLRAAADLRPIEANLKRCTIAQRAILSAAFGPTRYEGIEAYGDYPAAVLACPEAYQEAAETTRTLPDWLARRAHVAQHGSGEDQQEALAIVQRLRAAAEKRLAEALTAYGAEVSYRPESEADTVSLRELGRVLGLDHKTVPGELARRGIPAPSNSSAPNAKRRVPVKLLATFWPEAARALLLTA